jgi:hypothetical protein
MAVLRRPPTEAVFGDAQQAVLFGPAGGVASRQASEFAGESPVVPHEERFRGTAAGQALWEEVEVEQRVEPPLCQGAAKRSAPVVQAGRGKRLQ